MLVSKRIRRVHSTPIAARPTPACPRSHVVPRPPVIDLNGPGRLRTAHVLALCAFSHSTLHARMKSGKFPLPDGKDGGLNFWHTKTIRDYLNS